MFKLKWHAIPTLLLACLGPFVLGAEDPALTIYNQDFAVVREGIRLQLGEGATEVSFSEITAHLEPDSVILRDPEGGRTLRILEQNYRADPISQGLLLSLFEGRELDFEVIQEGEKKVIRGRLIRSGYVPHYSAMRNYGSQYAQRQMAAVNSGAGQPIVEVDGRLLFRLPGSPVFPDLSEDTILKPTIHWLIETDRPGRMEAELSYVTGGMSWEAAYNLVSPEKDDSIDLTGWVTIKNDSGRTFAEADIKLMAGDVSKVSPQGREQFRASFAERSELRDSQAITEKSFDEYHLYSLNRSTTLRDRQVKQLELLRATGVESRRVYVYDGAIIEWSRYGYDWRNIRQNRDFGVRSNPKVWVLREFENSRQNGLGLALPRGRVRFYRRDDDGRLEFTGENFIDHTPKDEKVRVYTGNAFDLMGERRRTDYQVDSRGDWLDEAFEIRLRNHKDEPVTVRVVEHLYRWTNWEILQSSHDHEKIESQTITFDVALEPDEERILTYRVHYSW
ncbi:MAG TPA: DUF4139 domain-containing protein [Acidobacteriota bacterium]|nr:DUF4139 domain-containing protein [Acidobacteriota bacterium]